MSGAASYDAGEELRVTRDAAGTLLLHHGARQVATIKQVIGGAYRVDADGRSWRLKTDDGGWTAQGDPAAALRRAGLFGSDRLTVGTVEHKVGGLKVKGLLRFRKDTHGTKPCLRGEILAPPRGEDPHALIVLATAAVVLGVNLKPPEAHIPAPESQATAAYHGPG